MKKLAIFDWNGTLIDDAEANWEGCNFCLSVFGKGPITFEHYRETMDFPILHLYARNGIDADTYLANFQTAASAFLDNYKKLAVASPLRRGATDILIASYDHQSQSAVNILKAPADCGDGTGCLVVDDLADTGSTFRAIRKILPQATYACLYVKPQGKPSADYFVTEVSQDTWIFLPWEDQDFPAHIHAKIGTHLS